MSGAYPVESTKPRRIMETNVTIRGEEKFRSFIEQEATIGYDAAKRDLEEQLLANEQASQYVLAPEN